MSNSLLQHPFFRLLIPLVAGILFGDMFPHALPAWGYLLLLPLFIFIVHRHRHSSQLYGAAVYLLIASIGYHLMSRQLNKTEFTFPDKQVAYKVRILERPETKERSVLCRITLLEEFDKNKVTGCSQQHLFLAYFPKDSATATLRRGDEVLIYARLSPPANNGNPDEFDYARYLKRKGYSGTTYIATGNWKKVGHDTSRSLRQAASDYREKVVSLYRQAGIGGDELAVLSALTVGYKEELSDEIAETYSVAGASHVLALSGLHIGLLYALFRWFSRLLWKRWKELKPLLILLMILLMGSFAFFTGMSSSVVRSVIMFSFLAVADLQYEKPLTMNTLAATAFLMLLYKPVWFFDVGFQLSFSAITAILLVQPKLHALWKAEHRLLRKVWGLMTVSVAAQLGTAPLVAFYFSRFSTHFLLTNIWVIPMVSLILYSAVLFLLLTPFSFVQQLFAQAVETLVYVQNTALRWIERLPFASIDGIWMDKWEVLLCFLVLATAYYGFLHRTARSIHIALFTLLLAASYRTVSTVLHAPQQSIVFYNVQGSPVLHCKTNGRHSWLVVADSLTNVARLRRNLSPHWNRLHLEAPHLITGDYSAPGLQVRNQMVLYAGKRICLLQDTSWQNKKSAHPVTVDYLYIPKTYKGRIEELTSLFSIGTVVLDASLSHYHRDRIVKDCVRLGISYLSLAEKGRLRILL